MLTLCSSLVFVSVAGNPILQILELRINDKQAQDFVRKQKARFIN